MIPEEFLTINLFAVDMAVYSEWVIHIYVYMYTSTVVQNVIIGHLKIIGLVVRQIRHHI